MSALSEANYLGDILKWELENRQSREQVTVLTGQDLSRGAVVGKVTKSTPTTGTADVGNTGNGTCTTVTAGAKAKLGTYELECTAAAADAGTFAVKAPDGTALPDAEVGVAYANEQINFTLNDADPDFAVGDKFTIEVSAGSGKIVEIDFDAVDGSQDACGFVIDAYDATSADVAGVAIVRDAQIVSSNLVWPDGATAAQKAAALAQLKENGIVTRVEV
jgi:hypothetical protein